MKAWCRCMATPACPICKQVVALARLAGKGTSVKYAEILHCEHEEIIEITVTPEIAKKEFTDQLMLFWNDIWPGHWVRDNHNPRKVFCDHVSIPVEGERAKCVTV